MEEVDTLQQEPNRAGAPSVSFAEAFRFWLKLGFISFGGPAGQIAIMHRELVERKRWISEARFLHALNFCMLLPGPEAQQLATYVGWLLHRIPGGLIAGGLFVLPSIFVLLGLSYLYAAHGETVLVAGLLSGFRPVVVAIVAEAVFRIGRRAIRKRTHLLFSLAAFAGIWLLEIPFPLIVGLAALGGWLASRQESGKRSSEKFPSPPPPDDGPPCRTKSNPLGILAAGLLLWLGGLALLVILSGRSSLLVDEYAFFTQAAFVTFGGAYAVLAYVSQAAAGTFGWLTQAQTVDGLALAETTPGPLIMVVQFVGFMAAWNHPVGGLSPLASGILGALVTTFVTFLPCFLFIFLGAPHLERLRSHRRLDSALAAVTAAVVGVVLNLALVFGSAVLLPGGVAAGRPDWLAAGTAALAFLALWRLRADVLWVILGGGLLGLLRGLL